MIEPVEIEDYSNVKVQTLGKGTNIDPINIKNQNATNPFEVGISLDVAIQTNYIEVLANSSISSKFRPKLVN